MEITYTVLGADGNSYGPVTAEQLKAWVAEGRIQADTQILRSDTNIWQLASQYAELQIPAPVAHPASAAALPGVPASVPPASPAQADEIAVLEKRIKGGASWFYWIAALTLVNTIVVQAGSEMSFVLGLMVSQIIDFAAVHSGEP